MGWNKLISSNIEKNYLKNIDQDFYQYFVHSYSVKTLKCNSTESIYEFEFGGEKFIAAAKKKNTIGLQFHPERSGLMGLKLLKELLRG